MLLPHVSLESLIGDILIQCCVTFLMVVVLLMCYCITLKSYCLSCDLLIKTTQNLKGYCTQIMIRYICGPKPVTLQNNL